MSLEIYRPGSILLLAPRLFQPFKHPLVGEVAGLVGIEVLHPGLGPDPVLRFIDDVKLALLVGPADAGPEPSVVVLFVDLDLAFRRQEFLSRQPFEDEGVGISRFHLGDCLGQGIGLQIGAFHYGVGDRVLAIFCLVAFDERMVLWRIDALEVVERGVMP